MTAANNHNAARILVSKTMKDKKLLKVYEGVEKLTDYFNNLTPELSKIRYSIDKKCLILLKRNIRMVKMYICHFKGIKNEII